MAESTWYGLVTCAVPSWVSAETRKADEKRKASALFGTSYNPSGPLQLDLPWGCEPELFVTTKPEHPFTPAFTGEIKSAGDSRALEGVAVYGVLGIVASYFQGIAEDSWRFFRDSPPLAYGLVATAYLAHVVVLEMVATVFVAPVSLPFVLGSPDHAAAIDALPRPEMTAPVDLPSTTLLGSYEDNLFWTTHPVEGKFYKVITTLAFDKHRCDDYFRSLYNVYATYKAACAAGGPHSTDRRPASLVDAELLYGLFSVAIEMPFVSDARHVTVIELQQDHVLNSVALALAWLLRHKLVYVDVRPPNILINGSAPPTGGGPASATLPESATPTVWVVDYDDCYVLDLAVKTREQARAAIAAARNVSTNTKVMRAWPAELEQRILRQFE